MRPFFVLAIWAMSIPPIVINGAVAGIKWNKGLQDFEPIPGLLSQGAEQQDRFSQIRREETHNFKGEPMRISFYEDPGFFEFYDNDTKARGICGDVWNVLSEFLNFTLVFDKSEAHAVGFRMQNDSFNGVLGYAQSNQIDIVPKLAAYKSRLNAVHFSPTLWMNRQRIYARATWNPNRHWMFHIFNAQSWYVVAIFVVVLSLASLVMERVSTERARQKHQFQSYFVHLFNTFSTLCNQGNASDIVGTASRILNLTIRIFAWLTLVGYNARLINSLTQEIFVAPFSDLGTLLDKTKIQILVVEGSFSQATFFSPFAHELFSRVRHAGRVSIVKNASEAYRRVCTEPDKYVLVDEEDTLATRGIMLCTLVPVGKDYHVSPIVSGMSKRVKNKRSMDIGLIKLHEFGLTSAITKRYLSIRTDESSTKQIKQLAIDVNRVSFLLALLFIGIVASMVICVAENIAYNAVAVRRQAGIRRNQNYN